MKIEYNITADAVYIELSDMPYSYGKDLDDMRRIDFDSSGKPRGIELLGVSAGVVTDRLPFRAEIEQLLGNEGIKVFV